MYGKSSPDLDGAILYTAEIKLAYISKNSMIENPKTQEMDTILLKLNFFRDQDGSIILSSAEKILTDTDDTPFTETTTSSYDSAEYQ